MLLKNIQSWINGCEYSWADAVKNVLFTTMTLGIARGVDIKLKSRKGGTTDHVPNSTQQGRHEFGYEHGKSYFPGSKYLGLRRSVVTENKIIINSGAESLGSTTIHELSHKNFATNYPDLRIAQRMEYFGSFIRYYDEFKAWRSQYIHEGSWFGSIKASIDAFDSLAVRTLNDDFNSYDPFYVLGTLGSSSYLMYDYLSNSNVCE